MDGRKQLIADLFTLVDILRKGGPYTVEELTTTMDGVTDSELADLTDKLAHVNDWLKLS